MKRYKCEIHIFKKGEILEEVITDNLYFNTDKAVINRLTQITDLIKSKDNVEMVVGKVNNQIVICK